jgi:hypothetical protein
MSLKEEKLQVEAHNLDNPITASGKLFDMTV